jgi:crossover junction endodeoxyribonuclease RuvC
MRVLGLDPGTARTGYGIVDGGENGLRRVASGVVELGRGSLAERLVLLHAELERLIATYHPVACAIEGLFHHRNARSALLLGQARGVCLLAAARHGLAIAEYPPASVKKGMAGNGAAHKEQVAAMVTRLLGEELETAPDATDALALALCYLEERRPLHLFE